MTIFRTIYFSCILTSLLHITSIGQTLPLLPYPTEVNIQNGTFAIHADFSLQISGPKSDRIDHTSRRFLKRLADYTTLRIDWLDPSEKQADLTIQYKTVQALQPIMDESYQLRIDSSGIYLRAQTDIGIIRGLETLLQCTRKDQDGFHFPNLYIMDQPRFPWRGLLLDVSRHFMPVEVVKRVLDGMAHAKLNVFHWHLTEDQGIRVESKVFPLLHQLGSDGMYYTQDQICDIVVYAGLRGIRVVPEFDMPGHATAWMAAYPHLGSAPGPYAIERYFGVFDPSMDPTKKSTYRFLDAFFKEMATLFPDEYMHIGGDENEGKHWNENPEILAFMKKNKLKDKHELQNYFNTKVYAILKKHGKKMMGWDEILQPGLDNNVLIQSWRGKEFMKEAALKGYQTVLSNGYYIDLSHSAARHYLNDPLPPDTDLTEEQQKYILGGEATMWAELVDEHNVESRIWPRTQAIAERLWSPSQIRDTDDLYRRLLETEKWMELSGSYHKRNRSYLIRRLSYGSDEKILESFLDWVEPLEGYKRHGTPPRYTSKVPLSRPVDASLPDAPAAMRWRGSRASGITKAEILNQSRLELHSIIANAPVWRQEFQSCSVKRGLLPLVDQMTESAKAGLSMIESLEKNSQSAEQLVGWRQILAMDKGPHEEMEQIVPDLLLELYVRFLD